MFISFLYPSLLMFISFLYPLSSDVYFVFLVDSPGPHSGSNTPYLLMFIFFLVEVRFHIPANMLPERVHPPHSDQNLDILDPLFDDLGSIPRTTHYTSHFKLSTHSPPPSLNLNSLL